MTEPEHAESSSGPISLLSRLGNYVVGATLLCYLTGFVITNFYLGTLGIVNLDLLRARYVLCGLLFLLFLGAIAYLVYGLLQVLSASRHEPVVKRVWQALSYSVTHIAALYAVILVASVITGTFDQLPVGVPRLSPIAPISAWWAQAPITLLRQTGQLYGILLLTGLVILLAFLVINPGDRQGVRTPRRRVFGDWYVHMRHEKAKPLALLLGTFAILYVVNMVLSLLAFMGSNRVSGLGGGPMLTSAWWRYMGAILAVYSIAALTLVFLHVSTPSAKPTESAPQVPRFASWLSLAAIALLTIVPVYVLGVYPNLPQQAGGGQMLPVQVILSDEQVRARLSGVGTEVYLIDRAARSSLFLVVDTRQPQYGVVEVTNDIILGLTYHDTP